MLVSESISKIENAPVVVLFGGNPYRLEEVIKLVQSVGDLTIYGTLSEEEGFTKIKSLAHVSLVLIGSRYFEEQRIRIRNFVKEELPNTKITEPGVEYPYDNETIIKDIKSKLNL
jgi:organic radical activating enzyme